MTELAQGVLATTDDEIIDEAMERFKFSSEAESKNRKEFEFDKRFVDGEQWDPNIRDERFNDRRPALTVNITDATTRKVKNSIRENMPRLVAHPVGNGADIDTAKTIDGIFRHIEYASSASYWYDNAVENAVDGGWGWLAVDNEYSSDNSFDQELRIKGYSNPLTCYGDPNSRMPDGSDMNYFIESKMMPRVEYKQTFGQLDQDGWKWVGEGDNVPDWSNKEEIRVAKYWRIEAKKDMLLELSDGQRVFQSETGLKKNVTNLLKGVTIARKREVLKKVVKCYLMTATKILKTTDWPGKYIPRVPVYGRRMDLNGKMTIKGMVRDLRDPARMYNYAKTAETEGYALAPKSQWIGAEGYMEGHEASWRDANRKPIVGLEYKPTQLETGEYAPPPQRMDPPKIQEGFTAWAEGTKSDFLYVSGQPHEPGQDMEGQVISGKAIRARQAMSDISNYDFYDNFCRSLNQLGRIIVDLLPHFYSEERMIRIIREDGTPSQVTINQPNPQQPQPANALGAFQQSPVPFQSKLGQTVKHIKNDLTIGDYEIVVDTGPDYQTKRQESTEATLHLLTTPLGEMISQNAGDVIVRGMDFPSSDMVADRLSAMIPAALIDSELENIPEEAKGIVAGLIQKNKQLMQQNMSLQMEIHTKSGLEQMKQQGETQRVQLKEQGENQRAGLKAQTAEKDTQTKAHTAMHDTHVKAVTAHDVAEIQVAGKMMDSHLDRAHDRQLAKEMIKETENDV